MSATNIGKRAVWTVAVTISLLLVFSAADRLRTRSETPTEANGHRMRTVVDFGAVGDGTADDTRAIQRAIDAGIGEIRFPRGIYRVTRPIVIRLADVGPTSLIADGPARVVMAGPGPAFRFIGPHGGTAAPHTVKPNVWRNERTPMVTGLEIVGAHSEACGIEARGTMQLTITRVTVREALHAIHLVERNRNLIVSDCHLYHNRGVGVYYDHVNLHQSNIIGSHISYNAGGGVVIRGGEVRNVHIGTCDIEGNMGDSDSPPTANVLLDATDGSIGEVAIVGCTIQHTVNGKNSANIRIDLKSLPRSITKELRHGHVTIADNVLSDVDVNVDIREARSVTITGNTMWQGYEVNMHLDHCETVVVANNVFDRNPRYLYRKPIAENRLIFERCRGVTFAGNQVVGVHVDPAAMVVRDSDEFLIDGCRFRDCAPAALLLERVGRSRVSDSLFAASGEQAAPSHPIVVRDGQEIDLSGNMWHGRAELSGRAIDAHGNRQLGKRPAP